MRAAVCIDDGSATAVVLEERKDPVADRDCGVLTVEGCGVCIADGEFVRGIGGPPHRSPIVLGHEIVGRVTSLGQDASPEAARLLDRRVLLDDARPCGTCEFCKRGAPRQCRSPHYGHISDDATMNWGGYAGLVSLDGRSNVHAISDDVPVALATFAFPLASGIEWLHRLAALAAGESVAVLGFSRMGVAAVAAAALKGAANITMVGGGAAGSAAQDAATSLGASIASIDDGSLADFDVVVIVTEASSDEVARGIELAAPMGRVVSASCSTNLISVEPESIRKRGLTIRGGRGHTAPSLLDAIKAVTEHSSWFASQGFLEVEPLERTDVVLSSLHNPEGRPRGVHVTITPTE